MSFFWRVFFFHSVDFFFTHRRDSGDSASIKTSLFPFCFFLSHSIKLEYINEMKKKPNSGARPSTKTSRARATPRSRSRRKTCTRPPNRSGPPAELSPASPGPSRGSGPRSARRRTRTGGRWCLSTRRTFGGAEVGEEERELRELKGFVEETEREGDVMFSISDCRVSFAVENREREREKERERALRSSAACKLLPRVSMFSLFLPRLRPSTLFSFLFCFSFFNYVDISRPPRGVFFLKSPFSLIPPRLKDYGR